MTSQIPNPYAKSKVLLPNHVTKHIAKRSHNPVFMNPLLKKNDTTIIHITSLVKASNKFLNGSVLVITEIVKHTKAHAATGKGQKMSPAMVGWRNRRSPMETEISNGIGFAPGNLLEGQWEWGDGYDGRVNNFRQWEGRL
ncbi:hypothetical protein L1987_43500 [Smallanthus sonchifolius]|uniref:Uncharacterized protein n=1 Tax=Smallanthus sonchifolius TaxID=185202 RepID=A0ACB9GMH9_9ASTR|nr:hypothetical protein L1987_43500 [Smallanthus sonchifolius]